MNGHFSQLQTGQSWIKTGTITPAYISRTLCKPALSVRPRFSLPHELPKLLAKVLPDCTRSVSQKQGRRKSEQREACSHTHTQRHRRIRRQTQTVETIRQSTTMTMKNTITTTTGMTTRRPPKIIRRPRRYYYQETNGNNLVRMYWWDSETPHRSGDWRNFPCAVRTRSRVLFTLHVRTPVCVPHSLDKTHTRTRTDTARSSEQARERGRENRLHVRAAWH